MKSDKIYEEISLIQKRGMIVYMFVEIMFVFLILVFWKIQILDYRRYWQLAESNRTGETLIPSPRGLILDRNGVILADNKASFRVSVIRENSLNLDESYQQMANLLNLKKEIIQKRIKRYESLPRFRPIVIKDNLSLPEVSRIEARKLERPELLLQSEPKRIYPFGKFAAHILGYMQEISPAELKSEHYPQRQPGDLVGKTGIEKQYDNLLQGKDGEVIEIVDSLGRKKGELSRKEPRQGQSVKLTLDFDLQQKAEELLEGREGAIVVLNPKNGEILALASYPEFDPNKFINRFSSEEWQDLVKSPEFPLENRAIRGLYAPGSIFKLTLALAALDLGLITDRTSYFCSGQIRIYGHLFSCWFKPGHGFVNLYSAIQHSCNIYFYQLGKKLGIEEIYRYACLFGFGAKTGIDLPGEKKGLVPNPEWKKKVKKAPWYPGETIVVAIGQGPILVTPLQVASQTALIANRGLRIVPHLLKSEIDPVSKKEVKKYSIHEDKIPVKQQIFDKVIKGMWKVVNEEGTARAAKIGGFNVCGKTGSTQVVNTVQGREKTALASRIKTHSWFTGFAPRDNPTVVVTVLVEYGGLGGATAAPLARELFKIFRKKYD
ncbi:MAG: penicillin-binding protein 2 [Candidatus Aminicenantales bacterium]